MSGDNGLSWSSVFRDKDSLDIRYVPEKLLHRNSELESLYNTFQNLRHPESEAPRNLLISGALGVGKSALSRFFGRLMEKQAGEVVYVHVDCFECRGRPYRVLSEAVQRVQPHFPDRGYSYEELFHILQNQLESQRIRMLLALDKAEFLYHTAKTYQLGLGFDSKTISTIHILDKEKELEKLSFIDKSLLQHNLLQLRKYSEADQRDIIEYRAAIAFREEVFTQESQDLLLEAVSSAGGNIGYGIDLMYVAGEVADEEKERRVHPLHIQEAKRRVWKNIRNRELSMLNVHERLFLVGTTYYLERRQRDYVTISEAEGCYGELCEHLNLPRRRHNQILEYVDRLSLLGCMEREIRSFGRGGRTSLLRIPEMPEAFLERELLRLGIK